MSLKIKLKFKFITTKIITYPIAENVTTQYPIENETAHAFFAYCTLSRYCL